MSLRWEYEELFDSFAEDYLDYREDGYSPREALARTWDEYEGVEKRGELERAVISIAYGERLLQQERVFKGSKERTVAQLIDLNLHQLQAQVTAEQGADLQTRRKHILERIEERPVDECPFARWLYRELTEEVRTFISSWLRENGADEMVSGVLKRFHRDCKNTRSENLIVKTTVVEFITEEQREDQLVRTLLHEIQSYPLDELREQLSDEERIDLSLRIQRVVG